MMSERYYDKIATELGIKSGQVKAVDGLLSTGATVPFIARYRKEMTGSLDEVAIGVIRDRLIGLAALDERRAAVIKSLEEQQALTEELQQALQAAVTLSMIEDLYLPYRPKRRTRASIAREKGLAPLAEIIFAQNAGVDPVREAQAYVSLEKGVATPADALDGARDIIAEKISEDADIRTRLRSLFEHAATLRSEIHTGKEEQAATYRDYFAWEEKALSAPSHRVLAIFRGDREEYLKVSIRPPEEQALALISAQVVKGDHATGAQVRLAAQDAFRRLLGSSLENEFRATLKRQADEEAMRVFAANLRELLMGPPLGRKPVLAIDPGFRTGCKVVCLDSQGGLRHHTVIYPEHSEQRRHEAEMSVRGLVKDYAAQAIAIGNGTASRETEAFIRALNLNIPVVMVNESGASVYSASATAREEFPDHDITVRGAVSIGRRLMDPLAELVKIDPKAIGVGQYQHDVDQTKLRERLDEVVMRCVNAVGVEVNTASKALLTYVSGLGPVLAGNILAYRGEHGPFKSRMELKKVPRLGTKAFEQAAGFLRIREGANPLDASAVHPERYALVKHMAEDLGCSVIDLLHDARLRARVNLSTYVDAQVGLPTLEDILAELGRPGRDPREQFEAFAFAEGIHKLGDLIPGMELPGIVTNVTNFGAFVDIGVHQDGLVHISQLSERFIKSPAEVVKVGQRVKVRVVSVDIKRNRISLSMRKPSTVS